MAPHGRLRMWDCDDCRSVWAWHGDACQGEGRGARAAHLGGATCYVRGGRAAGLDTLNERVPHLVARSTQYAPGPEHMDTGNTRGVRKWAISSRWCPYKTHLARRRRWLAHPSTAAACYKTLASRWGAQRHQARVSEQPPRHSPVPRRANAAALGRTAVAVGVATQAGAGARLTRLGRRLASRRLGPRQEHGQRAPAVRHTGEAALLPAICHPGAASRLASVRGRAVFGSRATTYACFTNGDIIVVPV